MERSGRCTALAALALLVVVLSPNAAASQPRESDGDDQRAQARRLFVRGSELANENRWRDALVAFERADALFPHPRTRYNIGYCERSLGRYTRAFKALSQALSLDEAQDASALTAEERADGKAVIDESRARFGQLALRLDDANATIAVDGRPIDRFGPEPLYLAGTRARGAGERAPSQRFVVMADPGKHTLVVKAGTRVGRATPTIEPGKRIAIRLRWHQAQDDAPPPEREPSGPDARVIAAIGFGALGLAGMGVAAGLSVHARSLQDEAEAACPQTTVCDNNDGFELSNEATRFANGATLALVLGGAALAAGGVLGLVVGLEGSEGSDGSEDAQLRFGVGTVTLAY